jgi:hypothetical protein
MRTGGILLCFHTSLLAISYRTCDIWNSVLSLLKTLLDHVWDDHLCLEHRVRRVVEKTGD